MVRLLSEKEKDYFLENIQPTDIKNLDIKEQEEVFEEELEEI